MTDLDTFLVLHGEHLHVMFEAPSDTSPYVIGVFRVRDDSEVDFRGMTQEDKEYILQKCKDEIMKRKGEK